MGNGSGIFSQFGIVTEATPLTPAAVTRFVEIDSETLKEKRHIAQGVGLRAGGMFRRGVRRILVAREAAGDVTFDVPTSGFGLYLQHMLGSFSAVATQIGVTGAYQQIHNPGSLLGKTFTAQKGVPDTTGAVNPITYPGSKITSWELTAAQHAIVKLKLSIDSVDELATTTGATALQSAVYGAQTGLFSFKDGAVLSGGTVTNVSGVLTATGTPVASVRQISLKGATPMKTDRFFAGSVTKAENIENNFRDITGQLDLEFSTMANYNQYQLDGSTVLQLNFVGGIVGSAASHYTLSFFLPLVKFEDGTTPAISGPEVVMVQVPFTALDDGTNGTMQVVYLSSDAAP